MSDDKRYRAAYLIADAMTWNSWRYQGAGYSSDVPGLGTVTLVGVVEDERGHDSFYDYPQGSEGDLSLTFWVEFSDGDERHYQKLGTSDSYGRESWGGGFVEVTPVEKIVFEYVKA